MRYRCAFLYDDGEQCVWHGPTVMCPAHNLIDRSVKKKALKQAIAKREVEARGIPAAIRRPRAKVKVSQPSRVQSAREVLDRRQLPVAHEYVDHTGPWRCVLADAGECEECDGKPDYDEWRRVKCRVD